MNFLPEQSQQPEMQLIFSLFLFFFSRKEDDGVHCTSALLGKFITTNNVRWAKYDKPADTDE